MKTVTVAAFNSLAEAELLKKRFLAAGIPAQICSDSNLDWAVEFSAFLTNGVTTMRPRPSVGVHIEVPRADFETALKIMNDWGTAEETETTTPDQLGPLPSRSPNGITGNRPSPPS